MPPLSPHGLACYQCDAPVDPVRSALRIVESRILRVCASCDAPALLEEAIDPQVEESEAFEAELLLAEENKINSDSPRSPRFRWQSGAGALAIAVIVSVPVLAMALANEDAMELANEDAMERIAPPEFGNERPITKLLSLESGPLELFEPEAALLVDATSWVHPVVGSEERVPSKGTRLFGAERPGNRPAECRKGHCGVDLDAPRGAPVVAVRPGVIEKVIYDENASGGRYVWIRHDDLGLRTEYFHFDRVAPGLEAGESVVAGQWLGTLGRSGIEHSEPHLHFALRDLRRGSRFINPLPFLEPATVMGLLDLRLAAAL